MVPGAISVLDPVQGAVPQLFTVAERVVLVWSLSVELDDGAVITTLVAGAAALPLAEVGVRMTSDPDRPDPLGGE